MEHIVILDNISTYPYFSSHILCLRRANRGRWHSPASCCILRFSIKKSCETIICWTLVEIRQYQGATPNTD